MLIIILVAVAALQVLALALHLHALIKIADLHGRLEFQRAALLTIIDHIYQIIPQDSPLRTDNVELSQEQGQRFMKALARNRRQPR